MVIGNDVHVGVVLGEIAGGVPMTTCPSFRGRIGSSRRTPGCPPVLSFGMARRVVGPDGGWILGDPGEDLDHGPSAAVNFHCTDIVRVALARDPESG